MKFPSRLAYMLITSLLLGSALFIPLAPVQAQQSRLRIEVPRTARSVQTDGTFVVWVVRENGQPDSPYTLYAMTLADEQPVKVATNVATSVGAGLDYERDLSISDGVVTWFEDDGSVVTLHAKNLRTDEEIMFETNAGRRQTNIGGTVIWWEPTLPSEPLLLYTRDSMTMSEPSVLTTSAYTPIGFGPSVASTSWVAWSRAPNPSGASPCWELFVMPATGGEPRTIDSIGCGYPEYDLVGNQLIYIDARNTQQQQQLVVTNLATSETVRSGPHDALYPTTEGRYVFWSKRRELERSQYTYDLWGYDPMTNSAFLVAGGSVTGGSSNPLRQIRPHARSGVLAWIATEGDRTYLRATPIADILPSAPIAQDDPAAAGRSYFPETSHTLGGSFRTYWEQNGGLAVFGYPLTEEFIQQSLDDDQGKTVQFFERQRFEHHPENAGTPYEVLIGRLGVETLAAQGRDWQTFPPADPQTPHYFAATGQAIAPEFWGYWHTNGLEFGDPGVSEREALALWGYPISPTLQETQDDGSTLTVQWFERARFEHHAHNPEPYKVLLSRLAADRLTAYGWYSDS